MTENVNSHFNSLLDQAGDGPKDLLDIMRKLMPDLVWEAPYRQFKTGPLTWQAFLPTGSVIILEDGAGYKVLYGSKTFHPYSDLEGAKEAAKNIVVEAAHNMFVPRDASS